MTKFTVRSACLLKDFISQSLKISGTKAKQLLDARKVFVNGQRVWIAGYKLKASDNVEAIISAHSDISASLDIQILVEDNEYLIVNKPAGIIINEHKNSLENKLKSDLKNPRLQAAHRLDKDTSGLVIFAKNPEAFTAIVKIFREFGIEKIYRGIAQGDLAKKFPAKFTLDKSIDGLSAETKIKILKSGGLASYFEAALITGRKHQIRRHLSEAGFPLLGEQIYQTRTLNNPLYRKIPRQMLHAAGVRFTNPFSGKILRASAPEPPDFLSALKLFQL